jgi:cytochrome c peroxidase
MHRHSPRAAVALAALVLTAFSFHLAARNKLPNPLITSNATGTLGTFSKTGGIDITNPFFQDLGTNGRTCNTCHVSSEAWSITPAGVQARFANTQGTDPIFRTNDGSNCPSADVSSVPARQSAYSLLLNKGLIRVSVPVPAGAEFTIVAIDDPYSCAETTTTQPALYRRPLPSTNLAFLSAVMWDGRETQPGAAMQANIEQQAIDATLGHAEASVPPTPQQARQIADFQIAMYTAQVSDTTAGTLTLRKGKGGPEHLSAQDFFIGINDPLGQNPSGAAFDPNAFTIYQAWTDLAGSDAVTRRRRSIARGQALFNTLPIAITGVGGLNDALGVAVINGTCTTCHDSPNVGNHSVVAPLNIGVADAHPVPALDTTALPVYTVRCEATGAETRVTDLGRALISGRCADVGKFKGPILRGLSARAPYFHNGSAATLLDAVDFYDQRFDLHLNAQQKADLVAFLQTL